MAFCIKCGNQLREGDKFCIRCGAPVHGTQNPQPVPQPGQQAAPPPSPKKKPELWKYVLTASVTFLAAAVLFLAVLKITGTKTDSGTADAALPDALVSAPALQAEAPQSAAPSETPGPSPTSQREFSVVQSPTPTETQAVPASPDVPPVEPEPTLSAVPGPADILEEIEGRAGFLTDSPWDPLAVYNDLNRDGVEDVLAIYEVMDGGMVQVQYELWSLDPSGPIQLGADTLYTEVGGNSGYVGIVRQDSDTYLAVVRSEADGDSFSDYYLYIPWDENGLGSSVCYLESRTSLNGGYDRYILGATKVSQEDFEARQADFSNLLYKVDLLAGAGNGDVMTFADIKRIYAS